VVHPYRYSHLRKYIYLPNCARQEEFTGFGTSISRRSLEDLRGFEAVHPYAALAVATGTFPPDLALDAADCWHLYSVMKSVIRSTKLDDVVKEVEMLSPEAFFRETPCIKSADMIEYEAALRRTVERWISTPSCKNLFANVISILNSSIEKQVRVMERSFNETSPYNIDEYQQSLLSLLDQLNSADALPALVFHYDRNGIECMAQALVASLEEAETKWKSNNAAWQAKLEIWQKWQSQAKVRQKKEDKFAKSVKGRTAEEELREKEGSWLESFNPDTPLSQFSFQFLRSKIAGQELEESIADLMSWKDIPEWMVNCLRRGIGVHHSGLNRKLRQLVESLFRAGTLRVVIATGAFLDLRQVTVRDVGARNKYALPNGHICW